MHRHLDDADSSLTYPRCGVAHGYANWIYRKHTPVTGAGIAAFASLRELDISHTNVDDAGVAGLERIPIRFSLQLAKCYAVTNVGHLS
jgi:hypothetical protein